MAQIQINGGSIDASKLQSYFRQIAEIIPTDSKVVGSVDSDEYRLQCSFTLSDSLVIGFSLTSIAKGGSL